MKRTAKKPAAKKVAAVAVAAAIVAAPPVLLKYQQEWVQDKSEVAVWEKSRRIGASWTDAADSVLTSSAAEGQDTLYIGYAEDMTREYIDDCAMWAKAFHQVAGAVEECVFVDADPEGGPSREIKAYRIDFASGSKILALSSRPRSIRGKQGKVTIDEAAFHDDLPGLIKAALALLIWGGRVRILSSHNGTENAFNQLVLDIRAGKWAYSLHRTTFDDAIEQGLTKRVALKTGKQWTPEWEDEWRKRILDLYKANADEELHVIPREGGGAWLTRAVIEACMYEAPIVRWKSPKDFVHWPEADRVSEMEAWCEAKLLPLIEQLDKGLQSFLGVDFGRYVDLSVFAPLVLERDLKRRAPFLVELRDCPFEQQKQCFIYLVSRMPKFRKGLLDKGGNGAYLAEVAMQRFGLRCEGVDLMPTWYLENTGPMKAAFEDKTMLVPKDAETLDDLRAFEMVRGVPRVPDVRTNAADGGKRHGDSGIALLLAHAASRSDFVPLDAWESTGRKRTGHQMADYFG